jgi:hypothetical protein
MTAADIRSPSHPDSQPVGPLCRSGDLAVTLHWERRGVGLHGQVVAEEHQRPPVPCGLPGPRSPRWGWTAIHCPPRRSSRWK